MLPGFTFETFSLKAAARCVKFGTGRSLDSGKLYIETLLGSVCDSFIRELLVEALEDDFAVNVVLAAAVVIVVELY